MKNIKNFRDYISNSNIKENVIVSNYLNDKISDKEFEQLFNAEMMQLNEGVGDWLQWLKDKVLNWTIGIYKSILDSPEVYYLKKGGEKLINILEKVFNFIKKFEQKHPLIFKCIVIFMIIVIIIVATSASAYAAKTGDTESSSNVINMSIGMLDKMDLKNYSDFDMMEAKALLIKMRDNTDTNFVFSDTAKKIAESALKVIKQSIEEYKITHDDTTARALFDWLQNGSKMVITNLSNFGNTTNISLGIK